MPLGKVGHKRGPVVFKYISLPCTLWTTMLSTSPALAIAFMAIKTIWPLLRWDKYAGLPLDGVGLHSNKGVPGARANGEGVLLVPLDENGVDG